MHLVVFVIDCVEQCSDLLSAWEQAGAVGITILDSTGLRRLRAAMRDDLPLIPSMRDLLAGQEAHHRTLFTVVPDEATVDRIAAATQQVVGDLSQPNSGFLFVVPVSRALGLQKHAHTKP
ncbi:MAG: hypothetical protein JXM73_04150 [Anaerolineae bacterium]|nr:hypothetical protein [Anaerolineae bacterium]